MGAIIYLTWGFYGLNCFGDMKQNKASSLLHLFNLHSVVIDVLQATCFKGYIWWNKCFTFLFLLLGEVIDLSTWYVVKIEFCVKSEIVM